jgi:glycosyltransferase 2 family protein
VESRSTIRRVLSAGLGMAAVAFLVVSIVGAIRRGEVVEWPHPLSFVGALILTAFGIWFASSAWLTILGETGPGHRRDFLTAQLTKYIPGVIWQPLSQVGLSTTRSVPSKSTAAGLLVFAGAQVCAGAVLAPLLAFASSAPTWVRVAGPFVGALALAGIWMGTPIAGRIASRSSSEVVRLAAEKVGVATGWRVLLPLAANLGLQGVSFWILIGQSLGIAALGAFAAAWVIGFLAVPFPAGIGVREAVLVLLLPVASAQVITVSVMQRIVVAAAELVLMFVSRSTR